jgi:hypothetical protein
MFMLELIEMQHVFSKEYAIHTNYGYRILEF